MLHKKYIKPSVRTKKIKTRLMTNRSKGDAFGLLGSSSLLANWQCSPCCSCCCT
ncbi:MAG: hypothetical protein AAB441_00045 [Patescibacteria group bacterium]